MSDLWDSSGIRSKCFRSIASLIQAKQILGRDNTVNLIHRDTNNLFNKFQQEFNNLFRSTFDHWPSSIDDDSTVITSEWMPSVDIVEEDKQFVISADIPGVDPKDIEVSMENNMLTIKGERKTEKKEDKNGCHRVECSKGIFYRRLTLPESADPDKITAKGKNGVLKITLGRRAAEKPKKLISVQS